MQSFLKPTACINLPVARLKKSAKFYCEKLGFREVYRDDQLGWLELAQLDGPLRIGLAEVQDVEPGGAVLVLEVTDIEAAKQALELEKIRVSDVSLVEGVARLASFSDPDDHLLMLRESIG